MYIIITISNFNLQVEKSEKSPNVLGCISELRWSYFMLDPIFERFTSWLIDSDKNIFSEIIFSKSYFCVKMWKFQNFGFDRGPINLWNNQASIF